MMTPFVNWSAVCLHLRSRYKPLSQVAKEVGSDWAHLNRLARGDTRQPRYDTGVRLLQLHLDKCPELHRPELIVLKGG